MAPVQDGSEADGDDWAAVDFTAWGTSMRLVVGDTEVLGRAEALLRRQLDEVDRAASRFRTDSELRALDDHRGLPARIGPVLTELVEVALRAARVSDGAVDPTVGSALISAGYDRDFSQIVRSGTTVRVTVAPVPGWQHVELVPDEDGGLLTMPAGTRIDLGATAKAWAADRAARTLAETFGCAVLVSLGGDIACEGARPGGWAVRVQDGVGDPDEPTSGASTTVTVTGGGLATSSLTVRQWTRGDTLMHHIIDPRTGMPATTPWRTVTVAAASCVDANIASTTAVVRGEAARQWLRRWNLPSRLVRTDGTVETVAGWPGPE